LDAIQSRTESRDMELKYRGYLSKYYFNGNFLDNDSLPLPEIFVNNILLNKFQPNTFSPLVQEENVAAPKHGATVIAGEVAPGGNLKTALLDGETKNFDMERGFTRHPIDDREDRGIVVKLGMACIINHLRLLLWDKGKNLYCDIVSRVIPEL
jgi:hypothetical protein